MPSYVTPKKNTIFIFYVGLVSQANTKIFKVNPTLAAGDFKVSTDGSAQGNLTTLPTVTPAGGQMVKITLSAAEMNGDNIIVVASDAAGAEWCDAIFNIQTSVQQVDDVSTQTSVTAIPTNPALATDYTAARAVKLDNLDAATSSRLASASYTAPDNTTIASIQADTNDIQTRIPTALVGGKIDSNASTVTDKTGYALSVAGVDAILDDVVEGTLTLREITRIMLASLAGKSSGGGTATIIFKGADGVTTRITATTDSNGNRTAITVSGA